MNKGIQTVSEQFREELREIIKFASAPSYAPDKPGEVRQIFLDAKKAAQELGWQPQVSLEEGMRRTVDYLRNHIVAPA